MLETFHFDWEDGRQPITSGNLGFGSTELYDDASSSPGQPAVGAFSPSHSYFLGVGVEEDLAVLGVSINPSDGLACAVTFQVKGGSINAAQDVRIELLNTAQTVLLFRSPLTTIPGNANIAAARYIPVSTTFTGSGPVILRLVLLGDQNGGNVIVDDIDISCRN